MPPLSAESTPLLGWWSPNGRPPLPGPEGLSEGLRRVGEPLFALSVDGGVAAGLGGTAGLGSAAGAGSFPLLGYAPPMRLEHLGDPAFLAEHGLRYPLVAGAMANGIASVELVCAMARAGFLAFFGSAGLDLARVEEAIDRLRAELGELPHGFNFIHSPSEPRLEDGLCELYLRKGVRLVEASAFMGLTPALVRYRATGLRRLPSGEIAAPNRVIAKLSRVEVAERFFSPAPAALLRELVASRRLTEEEARLAERVPVAQDLTVEADSGGHTDNRPLVTLLPTMLALRDRLQARYGYAARPRVGAAGGIATPESAAAAFAMGAAYVLTGSINQACVESGSSDAVRELLASAGQADTAMAPAADMFELGVKVQVLKRGTMFAMRAAKLYELYRAHDSLAALPPAERGRLERDLFRAPLETIWAQTREYFSRDPEQLARAERDPKHKLALVFRWYLGQSSRWANAGESTRALDYQIWCGPAMGAFNEWTKGGFMEHWRGRSAPVVAKNILWGAAVAARARALRCQRVALPEGTERIAPLPPERLEEYLS